VQGGGRGGARHALKAPSLLKEVSLCPRVQLSDNSTSSFSFFWGANNFRGENDFSIAFFSSFYILASKQVLRCGGWVTQWYTTDYYRAELLGSFRIRCGWWRWTSWVFCGLWQVIVQKWPIRMRCWLSIVDLFMSSLEPIAEDDSGGHISQQSIKHTIKQQKDLRHIGLSTETCKHHSSFFLPGVLAWDPGLSRGDPRKKKKPWHLCQVNWIATLDSYLGGRNARCASILDFWECNQGGDGMF